MQAEGPRRSPGRTVSRAMESARGGDPRSLLNRTTGGPLKEQQQQRKGRDQAVSRTDREPPVTSDLKIGFLETDVCAVSLKLSPWLQLEGS